MKTLVCTDQRMCVSVYVMVDVLTPCDIFNSVLCHYSNLCRRPGLRESWRLHQGLKKKDYPRTSEASLRLPSFLN